MELDPRSMAYRKMSLRKLSRAKALTRQKLIRKDEGTKVRRMTVALLTVSFSRFSRAPPQGGMPGRILKPPQGGAHLDKRTTEDEKP